MNFYSDAFDLCDRTDADPYDGSTGHACLQTRAQFTMLEKQVEHHQTIFATQVIGFSVIAILLLAILLKKVR